MKKRILVDARLYGLENSGIGRYLVNLIEQLGRITTNHKFIVLLRKKYYQDLVLPENIIKIQADFGHYSFSEQLLLPKILFSLKPDLVHFPHLNIPIFWKGKFVVTVHDLTMQRQKNDATTLPLPVYYIKRLPFLLVSQIAVRSSKKIIVPTKFVAEDITSFYKIDKSKINVIYEGITDQQSESDVNEKMVLNKYGIDKPYFFYLGNAYPHKNLKRAIEAIVELNKKRKNKVCLVIGGSRGVFTGRLKKEITKASAKEFVKLIGFVDDKDLPVINRESVGFLYPSLTEGFGLQGLEAMSGGTLLLCSDIRVFKEIYGDHAYYFNPFDYSSIVSMMERVLAMDDKKREKAIYRSQKYIQRYSWHKMAKETLEVYNSVLK